MRVLRWLTDALRGTDESVYADLDTMFGRTRVYHATDADGATLRVLDVEGTWQSACYVDGGRWNELAFSYHRCMEAAIFGCGGAISRMLMFGGGALSYPKYVLTHHADVRVDVVEVDPDITELARRYFLLDRLRASELSRLRITHADAARYLGERAADAPGSYDVIVNDAFGAACAPTALAGADAAAQTHALLAAGGLYVANVVAAIAGPDARHLAKATRALAHAFAHVWIIPLGADEPRVPDNNVVIATDGTYSFDGVLPADGLCP